MIVVADSGPLHYLIPLEQVDLLHEATGRAEAKRRHLRVTGTLGVLRSGAEQGLVNVPDLLDQLNDELLSGRGAHEHSLRAVAQTKELNTLVEHGDWTPVGGTRGRRRDARYTKETSRKGRFSWRRYP